MKFKKYNYKKSTSKYKNHYDYFSKFLEFKDKSIFYKGSNEKAILESEGKLMVQLKDKQYPAEAISWFLHKHCFPPPNMIIFFKDMNPLNINIENLNCVIKRTNFMLKQQYSLGNLFIYPVLENLK